VLNATLTLDAGGDSNALFIFKIDGAFATNASSKIVLINKASVCNVYWQVNGQVDLGPGSDFQGTIVANGAINLLAGAVLHGRALTKAGAISLNNTVITLDCGNRQIAGSIPTLSEWGLILLGILLLGAGTVYLVRRKTAFQVIAREKSGNARKVS
jgi:hypothetical protein